MLARQVIYYLSHASSLLRAPLLNLNFDDKSQKMTQSPCCPLGDIGSVMSEL
jgi:hypothetical protein